MLNQQQFPGMPQTKTQPPAARTTTDRLESLYRRNPELRDPVIAPQHGNSHYQSPLPGTGHLGKDFSSTNSLFSHKYNENRAEGAFDKYSDSPHYTTEAAKLSNLHPAQVALDDSYLYKKSHNDADPMVVEHEGRLHIMDGHHRVARAILNGDQFIAVNRWHG